MSNLSVSKRIKQIRLNANKTQSQFADEIGITQGNLSLLESAKTALNLETLQRLKTKYNLSYSYIIDGNISFADSKNLIPLVDHSAMAGYPASHSDDEYLSHLSRFRIPGFEDGDYKIFEVEGESMLPTLLPHDFIICVRITNFEKVLDGSLVVMIYDESVLVKRIYKAAKGKIRFESDNVNYKSIEVDSEDIKEMYGVQAKITQALHSNNSVTNQKLSELEDKVDKLNKDLGKLKNKI